MLHGRVASFDEQRGDGEFVTDNGERFYFHCLDIADGSRSIRVGVRADAERAVGHRGRDDAVNVVAVSEPDVAHQ
ncbi:MAG TPA: hypothetical protein VND83_06640 [Acidimicrobiales bacterium]|nr:hypothetical protein [Acidimicrobiales bacterium]